MDRQAKGRADGAAAAGAADGRAWLLVLLGLAAWQAWMTLSLFGPGAPWRRLLDDQPVVSGRHPLHLYHGLLGAQSFYDRGTLCAYDPAYQGGYPKTPVFDSGSRPAELFLLLAGGKYRPAAYKVGLAVCCALVPFLLMAAGRGLGLSRAGSCLVVALGLLVWWGIPGREALEAGDLHLLLAGVAALAYAGLLAGFDRAPGFRCWVGLLVLDALGWFLHPLLFCLLFPLLLVYYLSAGHRHRLAWHLALLGSSAGALAANAFWLTEWATYWWIRLPLQFDGEPLLHRTFHTVWSAPLWGSPADRTLAVILFGLGLLGVGVLNQGRQRTAARLLGLGAGGFWFLAVAGILWEPLGRLGTQQLLVPALWFAVPPAVVALVWTSRLACRWTGAPWRAAALGGALLLAGVIAEHRFFATLAARCAGSPPLAVGLGPERTALVETLKARTTPEARILWEDRPGGRETPRWTALLALLTGRAFLGGLDPDGCIEHAYARLVDPNLAGRPLVDWSDAELDDFCRRYNVGWVVCWSPAAVARFHQWKGAAGVVSVTDQGPGYLMPLRPGSYFLKGQGRLVYADRQGIVLADVVPDEDGKVVLSFHHQAGLQASPDRVQVEREPDANDPIPFIRLVLPGPAARVSLTWEPK
jgi:hypothetical protein